MRISLNWLKKYVNIKVEDDELIRLIGARLVEVEEVIDEAHKYDNIYIVRVEKAEKIPDTHLSLCQINVGKKDLVQVVCGAPNVRDGMLAVWIAPGATVPASVHEDAPFVIGKRKMLGKYESNGMLAGADELDFDTRHEKIAEIDPNMAEPGDLLMDVFELNDKILVIENKSLTHRPDCFGLIGFAREVAGILGEKFVEPEPDSAAELLLPGHAQGRKLRYASRAPKLTVPEVTNSATPEFSDQERSNSDALKSSVKISIESPTICPRYTALVLEKHGELQAKYLSEQDIWLSKAGMRPIDPIVDATNYLMLLTGQPLHAFDYDKFIKVGGTKKPHIKVRLAKSGEKLALLDGKTIELNSNDIIIASNNTPVALAGAMGGESTEIDDHTKNIILESASFSLYNLRKTQMSHGIFSEAITRFTKGQPPYQTLVVAKECAAKLKSGFKVTSVSDAYPEPAKQIVVKITTDTVNDLLGTDYSAAKITKTLENVGFEVTANMDSPEMNVLVPMWRTDIKIPEDIIEEVGRLRGYDNITPVLPLHETATKNPVFDFKTTLRDTLSRLGANEVLTYSFVSGRLLENANLEPKNSYKIVNSISPELQYIRQSLVPSLLDKAYVNQKIPFDKFALFEINQVYQKSWKLDDEKVPIEKTNLGFVLAERKNKGTAYYQAKHYVERLLGELNITAKFEPLTEFSAKKLGIMSAAAAPFEPKRSAVVIADSGDVLGVVGEFKNSVRYNFKLQPYLAGFELNIENLLQNRNKNHEIYLGSIEKRDLTVATKDNYAKLVAKIQKIIDDNHLTVKISPIGIYQPDQKDIKNISLHLEFLNEPNQKHLQKVMQKLEQL